MKRSSLFERRTKIVCTIGPATSSVAVIEQLIKAGMNVARLNLSHGTYKEHARYIRTVRKLSHRLAIPVAILIDLPGPKYRTGELKDGQAKLKKGAQVILTTRWVRGGGGVIPVNLATLPQDIKVGDTVLLDDGAMQLKVLERQGTEVRCKVVVGGILTDKRGLVVPQMRISGPFITDTLRESIFFAVKQEPDYVALSFVGDAKDVTGVRAVLHGNGADIPVIAKIERGMAVDRFDSILRASDGIMVARGDLGVDIPLERVPLVQKETIRKCNQAGTPVITATQMMESMVNAPSPTRAEVADVANAIFDGTDAIMLSAETSIGKYPLQAVEMMANIARETENRLPYDQMLSERGKWLEQKTDELISYSACYTAHSLGVAAIVAFTQSGSTAGRVSKYRPRTPILAITPDAMVVGRLMLRWGVYPFQIAGASSVDELFSTAAKLCRGLGLTKRGDLIVITGGIPVGVAGSTNLLKVEKIQ
ncbi:MAG: pyruvate kinase [Dehalococcoidia bacterium]|nr:pyruvate kinase [Dehalococcoidia bacterium]MDH4291180.1 pyruvate kinase [Dehalococcoidia bacterium]